MGTPHEHSPGCAMPGRTCHDMRGGCGSREPAAARREVGCRRAAHISDGQRGLPPGDPEASSRLASPLAAAESDGQQRVPRRRDSHGSRGFIVRLGLPRRRKRGCKCFSRVVALRSMKESLSPALRRPPCRPGSMGTGCAALASRTSGRDHMVRAVTAMQLTATGGRPVAWPSSAHAPHAALTRR